VPEKTAVERDAEALEKPFIEAREQNKNLYVAYQAKLAKLNALYRSDPTRLQREMANAVIVGLLSTNQCRTLLTYESILKIVI
jgi:hypothetical protein